MNPSVSQMKAYISKHLKEPITLSSIAKEPATPNITLHEYLKRKQA